MKIEMGESLFYSWLRHVKGCRIVQNNWKVSPQWKLEHEEELKKLMETLDVHFYRKNGYMIFKGNTTLRQLLRQGESDVMGMHISQGRNKAYAVEIAFHEAGLNYGDRKTTVMKVIEKYARAAFAVYGYLGVDEAEIIFASPKINPAVLNEIQPCVSDLNRIFKEQGINYKFYLIANKSFAEDIIKAVLDKSKEIADTSELFLRSYQLWSMFSNELRDKTETVPVKNAVSDIQTGIRENKLSIFKEIKKAAGVERKTYIPESFENLKIGQLAQQVLRPMLRDGYASPEEIEAMQTAVYSKEKFDLNYPLLVKEGNRFERVRYYANPFTIYGERYYMCSQWFEVPANNDRPHLLKWISLHK